MKPPNYPAEVVNNLSVCGLMLISLSLGIFRIPLRLGLVLLKSGISSISEGISHIILLSWLQLLGSVDWIL